MHLPTPCWVVSDAHLGVASAERERALLALLTAAPRDAKSLIVNGDLFEFWFEWGHVIPRAGYRAVAALAAAVEAVLPTLFIGGNHDCWGGESLVGDTGVSYHLGVWNGVIGKWRTRIDHGDGLRPIEDRGYRVLRSVLRHGLARRAFRLLHPDLGVALANATSHTSRQTRARDGGAGLRAIAFDALAGDPALDLFILGHSHVATLERAPAGGVYANAGGWLSEPTFLVIDDATISLRRWDDNASADGHRLNSLDRRAQEALP